MTSKRKDGPGAGGSSSASKAAKTHSNSRPSAASKSSTEKSSKISKPHKTDDDKPPKSSRSSHASTASSTTPAVSRLKEEEPLFPRGGGSVLSPLEHKQIHLQAKQDVLFEQQSDKAQKKTGHTIHKTKPKGQPRDSRAANLIGVEEDSVKPEGLNYKRLVKGSLVLGQVIEINPLGLALALPNNLVGHVPITAISTGLNKRIALEANGEDEDGEDGEDDNEDNESKDQDDTVDLQSIYKIGQYLRVYVSSTTEQMTAAAGKARKHIELSLQPEQTNIGLSGSDVVANVTVMAAVTSVEDHGYVMDIGLEDGSLTGFLSRKELDPYISSERIQQGAVLLCIVDKKSANGKVAQLSTLQSKIGKIQNFASSATTINSFLPGSAVELMVADASGRGLVGKVMGSLDVTADLMHSGLGNAVDLESKYKTGEKIKARVICNFPTAKDPKLGVSLLEHVLHLQPEVLVQGNKAPLEILPLSTTVDECTVTRVEPNVGLFVDIGVADFKGFVHISRLKDGKVDMLSQTTGPFKLESVHKGRVIGYSALDGIFQLSFQESVLDQPFLRVADVPIGSVVDGVVEKIMVGQDGVSGIIVRLADNVTGLVPEMHLSDVKLQHPEKKFREGMKVKARVLSTNPVKEQMRMTLKKTLINSEAMPLQSFDGVTVGLSVPGTILKLLPTGAVVQFYSSLHGFLPVSEMSEAFIRDPKEYFRIGQVVDVRVFSFDAESNKLYVSCKDPSAFSMEKQLALQKLALGDTVSAKVVQKTDDHVFVEIVESLLRAMLSVGQLTDGSSRKNMSTLRKIRVGQTLNELVVIDKNEGKRFIGLSKKPSLIQAGQNNKLLGRVDSATIGQVYAGFVKNITPTAIFVQFAGRLTALLPKARLAKATQLEKDFGMEKNQSISVEVLSVDVDNSRMVVLPASHGEIKSSGAPSVPANLAAENPVDKKIKYLSDVTVGVVTKAKITSVKATQLNVKFADNIQGRVDVSQIFDTWDEIKFPKSPLTKFSQNEIIRVKVLGVHDVNNHRFLPISHKSTHPVFELSAKVSDLENTNSPKVLSYEEISVGSTHLAFINNIKEPSAWVSLSPNIRGRVSLLDLSNDVSRLDQPSRSFPVGSALKVRVLAVDPTQSRLDLTARSSDSSAIEKLTWADVKPNMVLPGLITKLNDRQLIVQLSDAVSGPIHLVDLSDDFDDTDTTTYHKNGVIRVSVVSVDRGNKKLRLSARHSRVLNSAAKVKDLEITNVSQLHVGDIVRGFVKNISDKGLFVALGGDVTGMVKISNLSDRYLKDWKEQFQVDQLVKGRIITVDTAVGQLQMTLKSSEVDKDYVPLKNFEDLAEGQVVTGKVRKVEEYGAFVVVDESNNVSGLCHRTEMADKPVADARKLFSEGDVVKAIVLKINAKGRKINFGMKPAYFEEDGSESESEDEEDAGDLLDLDSDDEMLDGEDGVVITGTDNAVDDMDVEDDEEGSDSDESDEEMSDQPGEDLDTGGFDWSVNALNKTHGDADPTNDDPVNPPSRKKRKKATANDIDRTGDLDAYGPQSASDYEELLAQSPNSSALWIQYMAFQLQTAEVPAARAVAERAVNAIRFTEETEKLNAWIAYLNLEVRFGGEESTEEVFRRACEVNEPLRVYEKFLSILVQEGRLKKADALFQTLVKKFGSSSPDVWYNYGHFLNSVLDAPERSFTLISRATQALPKHAHIALMIRFATLQFTSAHPNPELGRTMFENLIASHPRRFDLWVQLLDHEDTAGADKKVVRNVFERALKTKGLRARTAKMWLKRWRDWEDKHGDKKGREKVVARAAAWVKAKEDASGAAGGERSSGGEGE